MKVVELFAGAGGLGLGVSLAGFKPVAIVERDKWACETLRQNRDLGYPLLADWPIHEQDVRSFDWGFTCNQVDLVTGGPPCQPFSMGGKHRANDDERDMFPVAVDVVRKLAPRAFIFENVKGLTRSAFANYYQYILLQLELPGLRRKPKELWHEHLSRLQAERIAAHRYNLNLTYSVVPTLVNAADFGVPQRRERVFIVGFRRDLEIDWAFPRPTHSLDSLIYDQWVSGIYWQRHGIQRSLRLKDPPFSKHRLGKLAAEGSDRTLKPWRTVRDALVGLSEPTDGDSDGIQNHRLQPGARPYPGHTGSPLDSPAKTLKAGDHGVPGGENMLVRSDGSVRYFSVRETARLQTFPDGYQFFGSWTESMRQLGNAVPVMLAREVASSVMRCLIEVDLKKVLNKPGLTWKRA